MRLSAQLNYPFHVTVDRQGNLFIGDLDNHRVRKVIGGIITTIAGNGTAGFSGDGGPAASAALNLPDGVAEFVSDLVQVEQLDDDLPAAGQLDFLRLSHVQVDRPQRRSERRRGRLPWRWEKWESG